MSPLEFMQWLAALVPRPRLHLIRVHGVLAPNAKPRALVVPQGPKFEEQATQAATNCIASYTMKPKAILVKCPWDHGSGSNSGSPGRTRS